MERLGIELVRERSDLRGRNINRAILDHFAERKVFEIERVRHWPSIREAEMQNVAVGDYVVLALEAELAGLTRAGLAAIGDIVLIGNGFGADKALFEIRVDDAGRLRGPGTLLDRPRARFLWPCGEVGDEVQKLVARANDAAETRLTQPDRLEIGFLFSLRQEGDFALDFRRHDGRGGALLGRLLLDQIGIGVAPVGRRFVDVADIENWLRRQEAQRLKKTPLFAANANGARRAPLFQFAEATLGERQQVLGLLVAALGLLLHLHDAPLEALEIGQHQLGFNRGDVGQRVDAALYMGDVAVVETTDDVGDRVAFANIRQKLIAEPFAL